MFYMIIKTNSQNIFEKLKIYMIYNKRNKFDILKRLEHPMKVKYT